MQQLAKETTSENLAYDCSAQLLDVVPLIMRRARAEARRRALPGTSIPQARVLHFLGQNPGASLSEVAEFVGLTMPSTSKLVQRLVSQGVVERRDGSDDRRRINLSLTEQGQTALARARLETREQLAHNLQHLSPRELATISDALKVLNRAFSEGGADVHVP